MSKWELTYRCVFTALSRRNWTLACSVYVRESLMSGPKGHAHEQDALMAAAHLQERREARYTVPIGIEVSGIAANGEVFHQHVLTRDVSEWGCGFVVPAELKVDDIVSVRVASQDPEE